MHDRKVFFSSLLEFGNPAKCEFITPRPAGSPLDPFPEVTWGKIRADPGIFKRRGGAIVPILGGPSGAERLTLKEVKFGLSRGGRTHCAPLNLSLNILVGPLMGGPNVACLCRLFSPMSPVEFKKGLYVPCHYTFYPHVAYD